jgi:hypothetical protein
MTPQQKGHSMVNFKLAGKLFRGALWRNQVRQVFTKSEGTIFRCTVILFALFITSCVYGSNTSAKKVEGTWVVQDVVDVAPVAGLDDAGLAAVVGKKISFSAAEIVFQQRQCKTPTLSWSHGKPQDFFSSYKIQTPKDWNTPVDRLDVQCASEHTIGPFLLRGQDLLFVWYGALLHAQKEKTSTSK